MCMKNVKNSNSLSCIWVSSLRSSISIMMLFISFRAVEATTNGGYSCVDRRWFLLPSPSAERARKSAELLLEWMSEPTNQPSTIAFASNMIDNLLKCFESRRTVRKGRERIWENYYKLRSSEAVRAVWATLLRESIGGDACPIFFLFVTDAIMEELIEQHFPVEPAHISKQHSASLSYEEVNALRYTAGCHQRSS